MRRFMHVTLKSPMSNLAPCPGFVDGRFFGFTHPLRGVKPENPKPQPTMASSSLVPLRMMPLTGEKAPTVGAKSASSPI